MGEIEGYTTRLPRGLQIFRQQRSRALVPKDTGLNSLDNAKGNQKVNRS